MSLSQLLIVLKLSEESSTFLGRMLLILIIYCVIAVIMYVIKLQLSKSERDLNPIFKFFYSVLMAPAYLLAGLFQGSVDSTKRSASAKKGAAKRKKIKW